MSFVRARPKIAVTIPTKRRTAAASVQIKSEPKNDANTTLQLTDDVPVETKLESVAIEASNGQEPSTSIESKQFFKRIRPPVQVHAKKSRTRPSGSDSEKPKPPVSETVIHPIETQDQVKEPPTAQPEVQVIVERPQTPPPPTSTLPISSPTKSPAKYRFARPVATDSIARRHSVHISSASESEDDGRRSLVSRMRKISENSAFTKSRVVDEEAVDDPSDVNDCFRGAYLPKKRKAKVSNHVRKIAEARRNFNRRFSREKPDRSNLKMFDLLFYNPNPPDDKVPAEKTEMKALVESREKQISEEAVDDAELQDEQESQEPAMPVPQVKIGANGEIILDEKSLVIETTDSRKCREAFKNSVPVFEDKIKRSSYYGKKHNKPKDWSPVELKCFYKALNSIGTDFALMEALFPGRSRANLKNKFKREEKINKVLIDKALSQPTSFNIAALKLEFEHERALVEKEAQRKLVEMQREAQVKKENMSKDFKQVDEMVRQRHLSNEFPEQMRRSKRKSVSRKLSSDFVDPFEFDETEEFEKRENQEVAVQVPAVSELTHPEDETQDIPRDEFFKLFKQNLQNMQPTTVTIEAPSAENAPVRLVINAENEVVEQSTIAQMETVFLVHGENSQLIENPKIENVENYAVEEEMSHRTIGGFNYFVLKSDRADCESQMSQLQELKPGSIVVMLSDAPNVPVENRLSTFLMVDKESADGVEVSAMPAVLPPDLRKVLINDLIPS